MWSDLSTKVGKAAATAADNTFGALVNHYGWDWEVPIVDWLLTHPDFLASTRGVQARTATCLELCLALKVWWDFSPLARWNLRELHELSRYLIKEEQGAMVGPDWAWPLVLMPFMAASTILGPRYKAEDKYLVHEFAIKAAQSPTWGGPQDARYGYYVQGQERVFPDERLEPKIFTYGAKTEENGWWGGFYTAVSAFCCDVPFAREIGDLFAGHVYTRYTTRDDGFGFWLCDDTYYIPAHYAELRQYYGHSAWPDEYRTDNQGICPFSPGPGVTRMTFNRPCPNVVNPTPNYAAAGCGVGMPYALMADGLEHLSPGWWLPRHVWGVVHLGRHYTDWPTMTYKGVVPDCDSFHWSDDYGGYVSEWGEPASYMSMGLAMGAVAAHKLGWDDISDDYLNQALEMLEWAKAHTLPPDPHITRLEYKLLVWAVVANSYARTALALLGFRL